MQPFSTSAKVHRGHAATYVIWVWSTHSSTKQVTVSAAIQQVKGTAAPRFSVCPDAAGATCTLGNLPQGQADELQARVPVRKDAKVGNHVTLTAKAAAKDATSFAASGSVEIVAPKPTAPATTSPTTPPPSISSLPPLPALPPIPDPGTTKTDPSGLFPTVSPQPTASAHAGAAAGRRSATGIRATSVSNTLPLNMRLVGGQLIGLVVLAAAITIAITRLSLRPRRPQEGGSDQQ